MPKPFADDDALWPDEDEIDDGDALKPLDDEEDGPLPHDSSRATTADLAADYELLTRTDHKWKIPVPIGLI